jgi:cyclic pyranopterin phosphate synthase
MREHVRRYSWKHDWNCAATTLRVLGEVFDVTLGNQVLEAALGMHGAGGYRAQCGLVGGALMFIGILGKSLDMSDEAIVQACYQCADGFDAQFGTLLCGELRPEGFDADAPPHLCEQLARDATAFTISFMSDLLEEIDGGKDEGRIASAARKTPRQLDEGLSHLDDEGHIRMVDVSHKADTMREAVARGEIRVRPETLRLIAAGETPKGDVLATARVAGVMGAKRAHELIPLCHPLPLTKVDVSFEVDEGNSRIEIEATARCVGKTGVEMEALTAVSIAALTVYDMAKAVEKTMRIGEIRLVRKSGGKSGEIKLE